MLTIVSLSQRAIKSEQDSTVARRMHNLDSSFKKVLDAVMNGNDESVLGAAIKAALTIDEEILHFTNESGENHFMNEAPFFFTNDRRQNYVENYSKIFSIKSTHNEDQLYVLRNGKNRNTPQIELVRLAKWEGAIEHAIEDAKAIAIYPKITLNDLRNAISFRS